MTDQEFPTFTEAIVLFRTAQRISKRSPATLKAYDSDFRALQRFASWDFATTHVDEIDVRQLRKALGDYEQNKDGKREHSTSSVRRICSTIESFYAYLVGDGYIDGSPMAGIKPPKMDKPRAKPPKGWEEDFTPKLLKSLKRADYKIGRYPWPERDIAIVIMAIATGVRASELAAMNIHDIDGEYPDFVVHVIKGKGSKPRDIPIEPEINEVLGQYLESRKERFPKWKQKGDDPLFLGSKCEDGTKRITYAQLNWIIKTRLRGAGLENRLEQNSAVHAFRHLYGSSLAADGVPINGIKDLMGHESITTSQGYIQSVGRDLREGAAKNRIYKAMSVLSEDD